MSTSTYSEHMRKDWDARAASDFIYFTLTTYGRGFKDLETYFRDGTYDGIALVRPVLARMRFDARGKRALDIGCGCGRIFGAFEALGFSDILGLDVSPAMVAQGTSTCPVKNAKFIVGNGHDLADVPSDSIDFCFSYNVFQHLPNQEIAFDYLAEVERVLRPDGVFQLHYRSRYPWRRQILSLLPSGVRERAQSAYRRAVGRQTNPEEANADLIAGTWLGKSISPQGLLGRLRQLGLSGTRIFPDYSYPDGTTYFAVGRKPQS